MSLVTEIDKIIIMVLVMLISPLNIGSNNIIDLIFFFCHFPLQCRLYVEEIFHTFMTATKEELKGAADKLKDMTPSPMNTMLEKESRSSAVKKKIDRSNKITENVPPTTPGISSHNQTDCWFCLSRCIVYRCIISVIDIVVGINNITTPIPVSGRGEWPGGGGPS